MGFPVTVADIVSRWRVLSTDETSVATIRLVDADTKLRLLRPTLLATYTAMATSTAKADLLDMIAETLVNAVVRYLRNPDVTIRQNIGSEGSVGVEYDTKVEGGVFIAPDDLYNIDLAVSVAGGVTRRRVGSQVLASTFPWRTAANSGNTLPTP